MAPHSFSHLTLRNVDETSIGVRISLNMTGGGSSSTGKSVISSDFSLKEQDTLLL